MSNLFRVDIIELQPPYATWRLACVLESQHTIQRVDIRQSRSAVRVCTSRWSCWRHELDISPIQVGPLDEHFAKDINVNLWKKIRTIVAFFDEDVNHDSGSMLCN